MELDCRVRGERVCVHVCGDNIYIYILYNNDYSSIIDIYFYETFSTLTLNI